MLTFRNEVLEGEVLEVLVQLPADTFDLLLSDPPYGLGTREPTIEEILAYLREEAELCQGGDFMGRDWNIPSVAVWKECFRVLKPGAHLFVFGGSRTFDLVSMGLRAAGFDLRDTISNNLFDTFVLQWVQGEGMPKSSNVSKMIDKMHGHTTPKGAKFSPVTADARAFYGYGTALKPAWEPVLVFRKPFSGSLTKNVLKHGTGALNIDATRIASDMSEFYSSTGKPRSGMGHAHGYGMGEGYGGENANPPHPNGRWPSNFTLSHAPECKPVGKKVLKGDQRGDPGGRRPSGFGDVGAEKGDPRPNSRVYGNEELVEYECVDGCPVKSLESESKEVSRFFPQWESKDLPEAPFFYCPKVSEKEASLEGRVENNHPTKKPEKLLRWLLKMGARDNSLVLDPYCGSGSTLVSAIREGCQFTGIDRDPEFVKLSRDRTSIVMADQETKNGYREAYNMMMSGDFDEEPL